MAGKIQLGQQKGLDELTDEILNREKFSYDLNGDAFYNQYKDKFTQQGKMAMMDTMGQAAALTGGYGSSYAQQVGQQTYQGYLQNLNDVVPELYQLARDNYDREGDALAQQHSLLSAQEEKEYGRHRDQVADEQYWSNLSYQREQDTKQQELDAATLMAQSGDYSRLAKFYNLSEGEVQALQNAANQSEDYTMTYDQAWDWYKETTDPSLLYGMVPDEVYWRLEGALQETDRVLSLQKKAVEEYNTWAALGADYYPLAGQKAMFAIEAMIEEKGWQLTRGEYEALSRYLEASVFGMAPSGTVSTSNDPMLEAYRGSGRTNPRTTR